MNWREFLFSFKGRVGRASYWGVQAVAIAIFLLTVAFEASTAAVPIAFLLIGALAWIYVLLAISTKRLHDRDKSAWWLLVFYFLSGMFDALGEHGYTDMGKLAFALLSFGFLVWGIVELGFLRGTDVPNRYGDVPTA
jgi:uncharacterized membrane protein YhaH (DUF805 family)